MKPRWQKGQYKEYIPAGTGYNAGWGGEEALDIEAIHSMAPDAKIVYVAARTPNDSSFYDAFTTIIDKHLADAVNNSWEGGTDVQEPPVDDRCLREPVQDGCRRRHRLLLLER